MTLRDVMGRYCDARGYVHTTTRKNKTRGQYEYAVRRFMEFAGAVSLADLGRRHLSDFAAEFLRLPVSSRPDIRPLPFHEAVKAADKEELPRASARTRDQNLGLRKSVMAYAVKEGLRLGDDPWSGYTPTEARQKVSEKQKKKPHSFSRAEMQKIIEHVRAYRHPETVDFWGPILAAHHGMRIEEYSQLRVADFAAHEGHLCVSVTDAGPDQTVKTANSLRTVSLHPKLIEWGFGDYVAARRLAGADFLFRRLDQRSGALVELTPDAYGRLADAYGKRFRNHDLLKIGITGHRAGTHSFRHGWTDLARNSGVIYEHRLALAGRDAETGERLLDATEKRYGHGFSIAVLAAEISKIMVLD